MNDNELAELRDRLDGIDSELSTLFVERLGIAEKIGAYKRANGLPITDEAREERVVARFMSVSEEHKDALAALAGLLISESKRVQRERVNVYLIGMPDCGKTRMGKKLKELLGMPLIDTDKFIMERTGATIDQIFASMGEEAFRSIETLVLSEVVRTGGRIVAAGGGLPLANNNAELMKNSGVTVFLDRSLEKLLGQSTVNRPLLREGGDIDANIKRLYDERHDRYAGLADITIDPDIEGAAEMLAESVRSIIDRL